MTLHEALEEARRRWGDSARVWKEWSCRHSSMRFHVGAMRGRYRMPAGSETVSWEAAFADADRRAASQKGEEPK